MPRKSKRDDLRSVNSLEAPLPQIESVRQPHLLGWLILIVGAGSTWYWYRPLPNEVTQSIHSVPESHSGGHSDLSPRWNGKRFDVPDIKEFLEEPDPIVDEREKKSEPQLLGKPTVALIPNTEQKPDLNQVLKSVVVPMVPVTPPSVQNLPPPSVWTEPDPSEISAKPKSQPTQWPDANYVPTTSPTAQTSTFRVPTPGIPPLLEAGSRTIQLKDESETVRTKSDLVAPSGLAIEQIRQPQFIRQPIVPKK